MHQREVRAKRRLEQVLPTRHFDLALALFDERAHAGRRQDAAEAIASRSDPLDEGALRRKLDGKFARHHLPLRLRVRADVADDYGLYEFGVDQLAHAHAWPSGIVGDDRQALFFLAHDFIHEAFGRAD